MGKLDAIDLSQIYLQQAISLMSSSFSFHRRLFALAIGSLPLCLSLATSAAEVAPAGQAAGQAIAPANPARNVAPASNLTPANGATNGATQAAPVAPASKPAQTLPASGADPTAPARNAGSVNRQAAPAAPVAAPAPASTSAPTAAPTINAVNRQPEATLQQLRACQNHAANRFNGILRDQVQTNTVRLGTDNSASVRWQFPNGTYGFCRLSPTAQLQEFGVYPGVWDSSNQRVARDIQPVEVCKRRLLQEFPDVTADNVTLTQSGQAEDGATAFRWQIKNGDAGFCSVNENGGVFEFAVKM
jgi:hypothetical protein